MPLKLKLGASERFVVNGVVITNGEYRATLTINNFAHVMREKDVLQEQDADTPTRRLYFAIQAMLMQPPPAATLVDSYRKLLAELRRAYVKPANLVVLDEVNRAVDSGDYYKGLIRLKPLLDYEAGLLNVERHEWRRTPRPANQPAWGAGRAAGRPGRRLHVVERQ